MPESDQLQTRPYRVGDRVRCVIDGIFPFGVFVRLDDGSFGYIRLRDLSLTGDARGLEEFGLRQQIWAVVTELPGERTHYGLSHRLTLDDPWPRFLANHQEGDVISGTVRGLSRDGVIIEPAPGIRVHVPLQELASWEVKEPKDLFWIEDQAQARIVRVVQKPPHMTASIKRLLERNAFYTSVLQRMDQSAAARAEAETTPEVPAGLTLGPVHLPAPLLLVDDTGELRETLAQRLREFGCEVVQAASGSAALDFIHRNTFALLIADLDMPDINGVGLLSQLRAEGNPLPVAVMSDPAFIVDNLPALLKLDVAAALPKPLEMEEVHHLLERLERGERPQLNPADWAQAQPADFFRAATGSVPGEGPIAIRLQRVLEDAVRDAGATQGAIFRLDPVSLQVEVTAFAPPMRVSPELIYGLRESPVKDVITEDQPLLETNIMADELQARRFAKLLLLLSFESCLAVPLRAGGKVESALFLFHRSPGMFNIYRQRDATAAAMLLSAQLKNEALEKQVRDLSGLLLSGELSAGFGHEVHNKLAILNLQFEHLAGEIEQMLNGVVQRGDPASTASVVAALNSATAASAELQRTVRDFRRLMGPRERELVDVNEVVRQAEVLMRPIARRSQVTLKLELGANLPLVQGSGLGLQQVILNLLLNATEHTGAKKDPTRVVTVSTSCCPARPGGPAAGDRNERRVEIRVSDTGPGIHHRLWERVFELGFTTRGSEGSGLGLFIARSLLNPMGGQISIESSFVPLGTTFLVELPGAG